MWKRIASRFIHPWQLRCFSRFIPVGSDSLRLSYGSSSISQLLWRHGRLCSFAIFRFYSRLGKKIQSSEVRKNNKIRAKSVLLIDDTGNNMGKMDTVVAIQIAKSRGLQLLQVTKDDDNPVFKLISTKQLWKDSKNQKERNKKDPKMIIKEIQLTVGISESDLETKLSTIRRFLHKSHSVKITVSQRRRQSSEHRTREDIIHLVLEHIKDVGIGTNKDINNSKRFVWCIVKPKDNVAC